MYDVDVDEHQVRLLVNHPQAIEQMHQVGVRAVRESRLLAPKRTGAGSLSIRHELVLGVLPEVRVSWDKDHYYMYFHQKGTRYMSPNPFLVFRVGTVYGDLGYAPSDTFMGG